MEGIAAPQTQHADTMFRLLFAQRIEGRRDVGGVKKLHTYYKLLTLHHYADASKVLPPSAIAKLHKITR